MDKKSKEQYIAKRLTYNKDSLDLYLNQYESYIQSRNWWHVFLPLCITFAISFLSSDSTLLGSKTYFDLFIILGLVLSTFALIVSVYLALKTKNPVTQLKKKLYTNYINQPDRNSLFIIKRIENREIQILVYKCKTWGCYFLPYTKIDSDEYELESQKKIAGILDYHPEDIEINMLLQKHEISEKYHQKENVVKEFHNYYFHLFASKSLKGRDITSTCQFNVGKRYFEWKTLAEIEADPRTQDKNQDILDMLRNNNSDFITNIASFSE